ncbi:hypothetical protein CBL_00288 [Carabus blaptoides fortunei]
MVPLRGPLKNDKRTEDEIRRFLAVTGKIHVLPDTVVMFNHDPTVDNSCAPLVQLLPPSPTPTKELKNLFKKRAARQERKDKRGRDEVNAPRVGVYPGQGMLVV